MRRRYKFTVKNQSRPGIFSTVIGVLALFLTGGVLMEAYTAYGQAGRIIAVLGFLALLLALVGLYQGIRGLREEDSYRLFPYVGCVLNGLLLTAFICVYMAGW